MGGQEIPMVSSYKYLSCVIDEHLTLKDMVEDRAAAGKRALGSWLGRYRREVGDVGVGTFKKLLNSLEESIILYGPLVLKSGAVYVASRLLNKCI